MKKLAIIALIYLEEDWKQTQDSLLQLNTLGGPDIFYANRDGVGNMSRAFNEEFIKSVKGRYEFVWFITNITFAAHVPRYLMDALMNPAMSHVAGIHPVMNSSDHPHQWHVPGGDQIRIVPFIEFTAPMFRCDKFEQYLLCEQTPYYYMDLIICDQLKGQGDFVVVHNKAEVYHTYLRNNKSTHPISIIRKQLRDYHTPISKKFMVKIYGEDWIQKLWKK